MLVSKGDKQATVGKRSLKCTIPSVRYKDTVFVCAVLSRQTVATDYAHRTEL